MSAVLSKPLGSVVTATDLFCGAGGSSQGVRKAGAIVKMAANHWRQAIETHQSNFPDTDHDCADVSQSDPRRYPRTTMLIASPSCTNHTGAKGVPRSHQQADLWGKKPDAGAERSRATMWDVPRFAEYHQYELIVVENVVEARQWVMWDAWIHAMQSLGYAYRCVYFNAMFALPAPQSRDRLYVVFWKKGNTAPNLDLTPTAYCPKCEKNISAVQSWKNGRTFGRYRTQYIYCCPHCASVVEPYYYAAANAIDWDIPTPLIGKRKTPLKDKTVRRIEAGLERFATSYQPSPYALYGQSVPETVLGALGGSYTPYTFSMGAWDNVYRRADEALPAQTSSRSNGLVMPFRLGIGTWDDTATVGLDQPAAPQTTKRWDGIVMPFIAEVGHGGPENASRMRTAELPMPTQHTLGGSSLITVPFAVPLAYDSIASKAARPVNDVLPTQTARQEIGYATAPFTISYYGADKEAHGIDKAMGTATTHDRHALVRPTEIPEVEECGFRVLTPKEVQRVMAFEDTYKVLGTNRDKVRQLGNAVVPVVMEIIIERCLATLR